MLNTCTAAKKKLANQSKEYFLHPSIHPPPVSGDAGALREGRGGGP